MDSKYQKWIDNYVATNKGCVLGSCREASKEMVEQFPELKTKRGWVDNFDGSNCQHWWCVTPVGEIIDPTASQFSTRGGVINYREVQPGEAARVRGCMYCGFDLYARSDEEAEKIMANPFCDNECSQAFADSMEYEAQSLNNSHDFDPYF